MNINALYPKVYGYFLYVGIAACLLVTGSMQAEARKQWTVIPVEVEGEQDTFISDFAIGEEGVPWVALSTPQHTICYLKDGKWRKLAGSFSTGIYLSRLYTSPNGKVYLSQSGREPFVNPPPDLKGHFGGLYLLEEGKATHVTDYYYEEARYGPKLYFDSKGRIWNWGNAFIAKYEDGEWEKVEASIGPCRIVENTKGNVFFIGNKTISYYKDGIFKTDIQLPDMAYKMSDASFKCCLWGDDKVLFINCAMKGAWVLDLERLEVQKFPFRKTALFESRLFDLFRDRQGSAWVLAHNNNKANDCFYIKVSAKDGKVEKLLSTAAIKWDYHRNFQYPESVLSTSDGTIYFGPPGDGVYILCNGQVSHVGWKQGITLNSTDWVFEGKDGTVWFASRRTGIVVYDPLGIQDGKPSSQFLSTWTEFPLACRTLITDFEGNIWCFLKDKPRTISKWDGQNWEHFEVDFDTTQIAMLFLDDLNRFHLRTYSSSSLFRLYGSRIERFRELRDMLVDSVNTGSREFQGSNILVTKNKKIWYTMSHDERINLYDGTQWHQFNMSDDIQHIYKYKDDSIIIRVQGEKFFTIDKGQIVEFKNQHILEHEFMLSESGDMIFDKALYEANKGTYYPMRRTYDAVYLFKNVDDFLDFRESNVSNSAIKLSKYIDRIWLVDGGFWSHDDNLARLNRYYKGLLLNVDLSTTPVGSNLWARQCNVAEDRSGNLWIQNRDKAFKIKRGTLDTVITTPKKIEYQARKIRIEFKGLSDNEESDKLKYAWRLDGNGWSQPSENNFVELFFNESGFHDFEVISIGETGNLDATAATLKLNIVIPTPEVRIVSLPDPSIELPVIIEYEVVKRQQDSRLLFQWRVDSGRWNNTSDTKVVLWSLEDGKHVFEVRAIEDNKYVQTKPAKDEFVLKTDFQSIILREIERLKSDSYDGRERASAALISIGEKCLPYLRKELEQPTRDTEWWINNVIWQIEH